MKINYNGSVTVTFTPKDENTRKILRLINWFNFVCKFPDEFVNHAPLLVKIFVNMEKRTQRLLKKQIKCPNCQIKITSSIDDTEFGKYVKHECSKCGYQFKESLKWW